MKISANILFFEYLNSNQLIVKHVLNLNSNRLVVKHVFLSYLINWSGVHMAKQKQFVFSILDK